MIRNAAESGAALSRSPNRISGVGACQSGREAALALARVRIRIYWIIGFSGFYELVSDWRAFIHIRLGGIYGYGETRKPGESES